MSWLASEARLSEDGATASARHAPGQREGRTISSGAGAGRRFYLDLHSHSTDASDDAGGTVEGYLKWIVARRKRGYIVDGFVLTEHRQFDPAVSYDALAEQYEVVVLRGAELETEVGHVLVYGISEEFSRRFDLSSVRLPSVEIFHVARETGGFAVGAHAGRASIGLAEHVAAGYSLEGVAQAHGLSRRSRRSTAAARTRRTHSPSSWRRSTASAAWAAATRTT